MNLKIDESKCIHCGQCINDCLSKALEFDENNIPKTAENGEKRCIGCQHCLTVCPTGALSIFGKNPEESDAVQQYNPDEILNLIKNRRSYRRYKSENLAPEVMEKLKNMLNWVPTGVNNHKLHFSFIDDVDVMNDFREYTNKKLIEIISKPGINGALKNLQGIKMLY